MTHDARRRVDLLAVTDGNTSTKLGATGLRVRIADDTWVALDFRRLADTALDIVIGLRSTRRPWNEHHKLAVVPRAGNKMNVEITFGGIEERRAFEVFPVNEPGERDRFLQMLAATSSGDPVGEILFREGAGAPVAAREFRVDCSGTGSLQVKLVPNGDAELHVQLMTMSGAIPASNSPMPMLCMFVSPHAANLISVCLRETTGVVLT